MSVYTGIIYHVDGATEPLIKRSNSPQPRPSITPTLKLTPPTLHATSHPNCLQTPTFTADMANPRDVAAAPQKWRNPEYRASVEGEFEMDPTSQNAGWKQGRGLTGQYPALSSNWGYA